IAPRTKQCAGARCPSRPPSCGTRRPACAAPFRRAALCPMVARDGDEPVTTTLLVDVLPCPRSDRAPLDENVNGYRCTACGVDFPRVGGIPRLFAERGAGLGEWRGRLHFSLRKLEQERIRLDAALARRSLRASTRKRVQALQAATVDHTQR